MTTALTPFFAKSSMAAAATSLATATIATSGTSGTSLIDAYAFNP
jgi:hypothetical protein